MQFVGLWSVWLYLDVYCMIIKCYIKFVLYVYLSDEFHFKVMLGSIVSFGIISYHMVLYHIILEKVKKG